MTLTGYDTGCAICMHAAEHGSWPSSHRGTHCRDCCRSWAGKKEVHCPVCHQHFASDRLADRHRVNGRCLTEDEIAHIVTQDGRKVFRQCVVADGSKIWRYAETLRLKPEFA